MKALVTGATGGLGRNLITRLHRDGHEVIATGRNALVGDKISREGIRFERFDLSDMGKLRHNARGCDVIFHCAALSSPWGRREEFETANVLGTINVSEAACRADARLVHVSTPSIYACFGDRLNISEFAELPKRPVNEYARTKLIAEKHVERTSRVNGLSAIILRPRGIFGPHDSVLMPRLIAAAKRGPIPLINGGRAIVDVTFVENVVDAMILAAEARHISRAEAFNISNGQGIAISDLINRALTSVGIPYATKKVPYWLADFAALGMELAARLGLMSGEPPITRYGVGLFAFDQTLDITRARNNLGYSPKVSITEGIERYAEWYRASLKRGED